jgi:hypothetical protein
MEQSPYREANSYTASQEMHRLSWDPKVHYRVHKDPPAVPILSHMLPVHTLPPYFPKTNYNIIFPSMSRSSKWSFHSHMKYKNLLDPQILLRTISTGCSTVEQFSSKGSFETSYREPRRPVLTKQDFAWNGVLKHFLTLCVSCWCQERHPDMNTHSYLSTLTQEAYLLYCSALTFIVLLSKHRSSAENHTTSYISIKQSTHWTQSRKGSWIHSNVYCTKNLPRLIWITVSKLIFNGKMLQEDWIFLTAESQR